jgi:hypothetical protein
MLADRNCAYKMVVLPAASRPTIRMRISFFEKRRLKSELREEKYHDAQLLIEHYLRHHLRLLLSAVLPPAPLTSLSHTHLILSPIALALPLRSPPFPSHLYW